MMVATARAAAALYPDNSPDAAQPRSRNGPKAVEARSPWSRFQRFCGNAAWLEPTPKRQRGPPPRKPASLDRLRAGKAFRPDAVFFSPYCGGNPHRTVCFGKRPKPFSLIRPYCPLPCACRGPNGASTSLS